MDQGELIEEACLRELEEEVGLKAIERENSKVKFSILKESTNTII